MWRLLVLSCLLALVSSQSTPVSQCRVNNGPLPINVEIEGCASTPCRLPQLQDVVMHIAFRAPRTMRRMKTLVSAFLIGNFGINHDLEEAAETCNFLTNSYCPVLENEVLLYTLKMFIERSFPVGVAPTLEFYVQDLETLENVFCIRVPIRIIAAIETLSPRNGTVFGHVDSDGN